MKIGIDIRCLMQDRFSGVSHYTDNLLRALFSVDSENQYILFYNTAGNRSVPKYNFKNVEYRKFSYPNKVLNFSMSFLRFPKIDKMMVGVDIIFLPNHMFFAWSEKCKKVVTMHDLSYKRFPEFISIKSKIWHYLIFSKKLCREADRIIAVSESTRNDLIRIYNIPKSKISIIHEGVGDEFNRIVRKSEIQDIKNKYNLPEKFFLFLGNIEERKNINSLIFAFEEFSKKIPDADYHLVFVGDKKMRTGKLLDTLKKTSFEKKIHFTDYIQDNERLLLYSSAAVLVYPSYYEGFGLPPLEALFAKIPVIVSFSSSMPEIVGKNAILIDPNNISDIVNALSAVTDRYEKNVDYFNGFDTSTWSWKKTAEKTLEVFESLKP